MIVFIYKWRKNAVFRRRRELKEQAQELLQECVRCAQELEEFDMVLN
jgi:hypothetical protein